MKTQIKALISAKPVLPGKLEEHYNVCGKAGCRCKDKINPRKHGPYFRLSYSIKGKNSSVFVKKEDASLVKELTENYKEARSNIQDLSLEMVQSYRENGINETLEKYQKLVEFEMKKKLGLSPEPTILRKCRTSCDSWKNKALERRSVLEKNHVKIRDLKKSRDSWKTKAIVAQEEVRTLQKKLDEADRKISEISKLNRNKKKLCPPKKMS